MEDIGQLIFVVLFILFGLISSSKKKAARPPPGSARLQEDAVSDVESPLPPETPSAAEEIAPPKPALAEELLVLLQGGQPEPASEPIVSQLEIDDAAESIETLEPAGVERHEQFHEKYMDVVPLPRPCVDEETAAATYRPRTRGPRPCVDEKPLASRPYAVAETSAERPYLIEGATTSQPYAIHAVSRGKQRLTRRELRHAFVMKEVLGPPKALE